MTELTSITEAQFSATVLHGGGDIVVRLTGNADIAAKPHLEPILGQVHRHARELRVERVRVDIRDLTFMNSSCFKDLIWWLEQVREATATERYRISFISSGAQHWQRRSLHALSCFARDLVTIEAG